MLLGPVDVSLTAALVPIFIRGKAAYTPGTKGCGMLFAFHCDAID